jgi:hypothetical protein
VPCVGQEADVGRQNPRGPGVAQLGDPDCAPRAGAWKRCEKGAQWALHGPSSALRFVSLGGGSTW